jgi:hypothetical protein
MHPYFTHKEYLKKELASLKSDAVVLELGIGDGSSPLMYDFCRDNPIAKVVGLETDQDWTDKIKNEYSLPNYEIDFIETWDGFENNLKDKFFDLVFVDQHPWEARVYSIKVLKDKAHTFILHDYDHYNKGIANNIYINDESSWLYQNYGDIYNFEDHYDILPPTTILRRK